MTATVKDRVAYGAITLDIEVPGWRSKIDLETLDMTNDNCILGQLFGSYTNGLDRLGIRWGVPYGFASTAYEVDIEVSHLHEEWKATINTKPQ